MTVDDQITEDEEGGYIDEGDDPFEEAVFNDY